MPFLEDKVEATKTTYASTVLKLEGAAVMLAAGYAFHLLDGAWLWFFIFFLVPDLFMVGYLNGPRIGAAIYNVAHTYLFAFAIALLWFPIGEVEVLRIAAVWTAHIGLDRMLGFGLKDVAAVRV